MHVAIVLEVAELEGMHATLKVANQERATTNPRSWRRKASWMPVQLKQRGRLWHGLGLRARTERAGCTGADVSIFWPVNVRKGVPMTEGVLVV